MVKASYSYNLSSYLISHKMSVKLALAYFDTWANRECDLNDSEWLFVSIKKDLRMND